jgi:quercetin dioxygenase-like cupin family protein
MNMPDPTITVCGDIAFRSDRMPAGAVVESHAHDFQHTTFCTFGAIEIVWWEGAARHSRVLRAGDLRPYMIIPAGVKHQLKALEDGSVYHCIYTHRTAQGEVVEYYTGRDYTADGRYIYG